MNIVLDLINSDNHFVDGREKLFIDFLANHPNESEIAAVTAAWKFRGATPQELAAISQYIRKELLNIIDIPNQTIIDCCGTGGDNSGSFNISTTVAFVLASMGICVAKHGGRKTTSKSGSIDFLESLGVETLSDSDKIQNSLRNQNLAFIASPALHQVLGRWKQICKKLSFTGMTGMIGTLTNPVNISHQILGVPNMELGELMANSLKEIDRPNAIVIYGEPGLDEGSICGKNHIWELRHGNIKYYTLSPSELNLDTYSLKDIAGGSPSDNALMFKDFIQGKASKAINYSIILNTALGLYLTGETKSIEEGFNKAEIAIHSGQIHDFYKSFSAANAL